MSLYVIPTDPTVTAVSPWIEQGAQLEGVEYLLVFLWSDRETCWYVNLADQDENPIGTGIKLVASATAHAKDLLTRFRTDPRVPPGLLYLVDTIGQAEIATAGDLGSRHLLCYLTSDDPALVGMKLSAFA